MRKAAEHRRQCSCRIILRRLRDFERVMNAWYPTGTDRRLSGGRRWLLRGAAAWRWKTGFYRWPYELAALQKVMRYQRPETTGF